ncbi:murein biosynthesis integral membrane protein MurJ [Mycobacterium sp.]|uniref:murein biosynthesis integral membrane protein MurJ n=1 Tax=Mycobacterium sp. TaxID=1785 RepID=UPI002DAE41D4|nr:lipid II flippase MurJ [Mycobacterium sp.]
MSAWTLVSRVTGLGRVIVIGAVLGPTFLANSFVTTNVMPNLAYLAIAGSVLSAVVVPAIVRTTAATGNQSAVDLLGQLAGFLLRVAGLASALLLVGSPVIAWLLTFGIADAATRSRAEHLTVVMLLFIAPQIVFYMIATLGAAAQQARGRFALAAAAPAVENVGVIATVAAVGFVFGTGVEMDAAPLGLVVLLCLGSTLSVALHMALQLFGASRVGLPIRPRLLRRADSVTLEVTHRIGQSIVVAASPCVAYFALLALAATVPGGVLVVQMAYHVYALPVALGARAVSTAVMPGLSVAAGRSDRKLFSEKVREGIAYTFIASLPPLFLMVAFASPIADVLANGRLRVEELIQALAGCLVVLAVAQVAAGLREVCLQGLFARLDVRRPRIIALSGLGVTLAAGLFTLHVLAGTDRLIGLSCAVLAGDIAAAVTAMLLLQRAVRPEALADRRRLMAAALASTVMLPVVAGGWLLIDVLADNRIEDLLIMGLTSMLALGLFALILRRHTRSRLGVAA